MDDLIKNSNIVVVKVGSSFLVDPVTRMVNQDWLDSLVDDVVTLQNAGKNVVIVSSGAIMLGANILKVNPSKLKLQEKQNVAVCGQVQLTNLYNKSFQRHGLNAAQMLLTIEDLENRKKISSISSTFSYFFDKNIVPIVNENDLVANTEIRFGDNDRLSARVALLVKADLLILLSLVDGLYTSDPKLNQKHQFISEIYEISTDVEAMATDSEQKTGGMSAKLVSAKIALNNNCNVIISNGNYAHPLKRISEGSKYSKFIVKPDSTTKYKIG